MTFPSCEVVVNEASQLSHGRNLKNGKNEMTLGYDTQAKINQVVCKNLKHITVKFSALFGTDALTLAEKLLKGFSGEFQKVHENDKAVRNLQCKVLIKGFSIGEDLGGKTSARLVDIRKDFERRTGLHISGLDVMYQQVDNSKKESPSWSFSFTFYEVDPTEPEF